MVPKAIEAQKTDIRREPWYPLAVPRTESLLYLACWVPRIQSDAIGWIYPDKPPSNIGAVIRARRALQHLQYLKATSDPANLRKIMLASRPEPFILYAETQLATRRSLRGRRSLSREERIVLEKILDSKWFRESLDGDLLHMRDLLDTEGALRIIAEYAEEIFAMSQVLAMYFSLKDPSTEEILRQGKDFDAFMKGWSETNLETKPKILEVLPRVATSLRRLLPDDERTDLLIKNTLDHAPFPPLCIPAALAQKLSTIGRVPMTLTLSLLEALGLREY